MKVKVATKFAIELHFIYSTQINEISTQANTDSGIIRRKATTKEMRSFMTQRTHVRSYYRYTATLYYFCYARYQQQSIRH